MVLFFVQFLEIGKEILVDSKRSFNNNTFASLKKHYFYSILVGFEISLDSKSQFTRIYLTVLPTRSASVGSWIQILFVPLRSKEYEDGQHRPCYPTNLYQYG